MAKLRLDLDALVVDSFDTMAALAFRGTIDANQFEANALTDVIKRSQSNCEDCYFTLPATCMSCGAVECTMASKTECPSCFNSCNGCGPTGACPIHPSPNPLPVDPRAT
jgi:hypothetical protein